MRPAFRAALCPAVLAVCIALLSGCNVTSQGTDTVEVTGTVMRDGSAVEAANVVFHPVDGGEHAIASQAVTDARGQFRLATHAGGGKFKPGVVPGKYAVAISKLDTAAITSTFAPPKNLLPKRYGDASSSGITVEVAAGKENDVRFTLDVN
ncbi:MAG: carboxypeptidase-like regulatory domain-containing protein [Planctomycetes bacterium]|nr:carboxypeptidase-like regulatory domain-containing protein [Planctomycetota bacterium]